jgi:DNA-binding NtrC family response regulator
MATDRSRAGRGLPLGPRRFLVLSSCILIIDDDPDFRETFGEALKRADFDVVLAADGEEALAAMERYAVSLVITDMLMPGMDGIDVIHAIRQRNPGLKVIAVSGGSVSRGTPSLTMASQVGADRALRKPFGARRLVWLVRELLDTPPPAAGD